MLYIISIIAIIVLDQIAKYLAVTKLKPIPTYPLIENVFHLTYRENNGAAFSILRDKQMFLIIITSIVIVAMIVYLFKVNNKPKYKILCISLTMIIGGAIGNLIDRVRLNYVIDFFDFNLINFAIFNTADVFIVCGAILLSYAILFTDIDI